MVMTTSSSAAATLPVSGLGDRLRIYWHILTVGFVTNISIIIVTSLVSTYSRHYTSRLCLKLQ